MSFDISNLKKLSKESLRDVKSIELIKFFMFNDSFAEMIEKMEMTNKLNLGIKVSNSLFKELILKYYFSEEDPELRKRTLLLSNELISIYNSLLELSFVSREQLSIHRQDGLFAKLLKIMAKNGVLIAIKLSTTVQAKYIVTITYLSNYLDKKEVYALNFANNNIELKSTSDPQKNKVTVPYSFDFDQKNQTHAKLCNLFKNIANYCKKPTKIVKCKICDRDYKVFNSIKKPKHYICTECDELLRIFATAQGSLFKSVVQKYKRDKERNMSSKDISLSIVSNVNEDFGQQTQSLMDKIFP